jgi:hypothetical protein
MIPLIGCDIGMPKKEFQKKSPKKLISPLPLLLKIIKKLTIEDTLPEEPIIDKEFSENKDRKSLERAFENIGALE